MSILKNVTLFWAKVIGDPVPNYDGDGLEWAVDLCKLTSEHLKQLQDDGMSSFYLKDKDDERGKFLQYKRAGTRKDGVASKPIPIVDKYGKKWNGSLLGNGTIADIKYAINEVQPPKGKPRGKIAVLAIMIREHVPYEKSPMDGFEFEKEPPFDLESTDWELE